MAGYTYPVARPDGQLTEEQIQLLLANPALISRRIAELADQKFLADFLLSGRYTAQGGGIFYESGEELFAEDDPREVSPGAEYPKTVMSRGEIEAARTVKWGLATEITDESITRQGVNPVDRSMTRIANSIVRHVDRTAWGVIDDKVTQATPAAGAWDTVPAIVETLLGAQAAVAEIGVDLGGITVDTVVLSGAQYASIMGTFMNAGVLPRENGNPIVSGTVPTNLLGFTWVTSPNISGTDPILLDRTQLGGMAEEKITSPGYVQSGGFGIEAKTFRIEGRDAWQAQARRVTVPVVLEPYAATRITGTGLGVDES